MADKLWLRLVQSKGTKILKEVFIMVDLRLAWAAVILVSHQWWLFGDDSF